MPRTKYKKKARARVGSSALSENGKMVVSSFFNGIDTHELGLEELYEKIKDFPYTPKELKFIAAYLDNGFNGRQAAVAAGYSRNSAAVQAHELLKKEHVRFRVAFELAKVYQSSIISLHERKEILTRISRADILDLVEIRNGKVQVKDGISEEDKARIKGAIRKIKTEEIPTREGYITKTEIEMHDNRSAIDTLNKMDKVYEDRLKMTLALVEIDSEDADL